ncbi:unannotated protein [freshwater metagenome]|uniref:Unannotated protein n=1 Tax=freshwater metagenome TaxID=449393 RepID=A0A6J6QF24_9ZZZZ
MIIGMSCSMITSVSPSSSLSLTMSRARASLSFCATPELGSSSSSIVGSSATRQAISVMRRVPVESSWIWLER